MWVQAACFFVLLAASFSTACGEGNLPVLRIVLNTSLCSASHSDNASRCPSSSTTGDCSSQVSRRSAVSSILSQASASFLLVNDIFSSPSRMTTYLTSTAILQPLIYLCLYTVYCKAARKAIYSKRHTQTFSYILRAGK